jgi:hypothetical protein
MQRVTRSSAVATMPPRPASPGAPGWFSQGNPGSGIPATVPGYEWFNGVQAELIAVIERSGLVPDADTLDQVRRSLDRLHGGGVTSVSANVTLTADSAGLVLVDATGGARTITLPAANAANGRPIQFRFVRLDATANAVTIQRAGGDTFRGGATSVTMPRSSALLIASDGASVWDTLGEHARGRSIGANGWITHPGGLIQQWGTATLVSTSAGAGGFGGLAAITFPLTFPTACLNAVAITQSPGSMTFEEHEIKLTISAVSATQLTLAATRISGAFGAGDTVGILWQAIGW